MPIADVIARSRRKWRQIASSELALPGKIAYCFDSALGFFRPPLRTGHRKYRLKGGARVLLRENSTDRKVFDEIFLEKTYAGFAEADSRPDVAAAPLILIDLGANVGLSAIALARQLRPQGIVAVEPDGASFAMLQQNLRLAGLSERSKAIRAFAGAERGFAELVDSGNGAWGMRMGACVRAGIPVWRIEDLAAVALHLFVGVNAPARILLKCDVEGAEAQIFQSLACWDHLVERVILELHTEFFSAASLRRCLDGSHYLWRVEGEIAPDAVLAVIALERGELKTTPQTQRAAVS